MKHTKDLIFFASICLIIVITGLGLGKSSPAMAATPTGVLQESLERGTLRVGMSSFVPWVMQDKKGKYIGFEVDVATRLARDFGLELEILPTRWSGIVPALLTGKFAVIIGGLSITPDRSLRANFTIPYDHVVIEVIGRKDKLQETNSLEAYNNPETIVSVRTGTSAAAAAKKVLPKATLRYFDEEVTAVQEVVTGRANLFFTSAPFGAFEVLRDPDNLRHAIEEGIFPQPIAMAIRKGDMDTLNAFDAWIRNVESEGWLEEKRRYWFQSKEWEHLLQ